MLLLSTYGLSEMHDLSLLVATTESFSEEKVKSFAAFTSVLTSEDRPGTAFMLSDVLALTLQIFSGFEGEALIFGGGLFRGEPLFYAKTDGTSPST